MRFDEIWAIENFLLLDSAVESKPFRAGRGIWKMKLYPFGSDSGGSRDRHVAVYLQLVDLSAGKNSRSRWLFAVLKFSLLDGRGKTVWSEEKAGYDAEEKRFALSDHAATLFGYEKFISRKRLTRLVASENRFLPNGKLVVKCQIRTRQGGRNAELPDDSIPTPMADFAQMVRRAKDVPDAAPDAFSSNFSDVVFRVDGFQFDCHKVIVSRKSSVFRDLFVAYDNDGFELGTALEFDLMLTNLVFRDALTHMYGSTPEVLSLSFVKFNKNWSVNVKRVAALTVFGHKYGVQLLVELCEAKLIEAFRERSRELTRKNEGPAKRRRSAQRRREDALHFHDKPFSLEKMTEVARHVKASALVAYLDACKDRRSMDE